MTDESLSHIVQLVSQHGTDCWWTLPTEELLAPQYRDNGRTYERGYDTLDVWFDSGTSWASAWASVANAGREAGTERRPTFDTHRTADVVLEGSDQHRGWFQSSLLVGVAATGTTLRVDALGADLRLATHAIVCVLDACLVCRSLSVGSRCRAVPQHCHARLRAG